MKNRIKLIMDNENLTPAKFADRLGINRAIISHILNGRNNPSLDVVTRILNEMDYISSDWLLNGKGNMYKTEPNQDSLNLEPNLFNQDSLDYDEVYDDSEKLKDTSLHTNENKAQRTDYKNIKVEKNSAKEIAQIIIYYTDKTFEVFQR